MPTRTFTANSRRDILDGLYTFAVANGWTGQYNTATGSGTTNQIAMSRGNCLMSIGAEGTANTTIMDALTQAAVPLERIRFMTNSAFLTNQTYNGHTRGDNNLDDGDDDYPYIDDLVGETEVHLYANGDGTITNRSTYIHGFIRASDGLRWSGFSFGLLDKIGFTTPDIAYCVVNRYTWWADRLDPVNSAENDLHQPSSTINIWMGGPDWYTLRIPSGVLDTSFGYPAGDNVFSHNITGRNDNLGIFLSTSNTTAGRINNIVRRDQRTGNATDTVSGLIQAYNSTQSQNTTGGHPMWSIPVIVFGPNTIRTYIGEIPDLRLIDARSLNPEEEFQQGSDTWQAFPWCRAGLDMNTRLGSQPLLVPNSGFLWSGGQGNHMSSFASLTLGGTPPQLDDRLLTPTGVLAPGAIGISERSTDSTGDPTLIRSRHVIRIAGQDEPASQTFNRIWVVPNEISSNNPEINVPIPFAIWNAFPRANELDAITGGITGLQITPSSGTSFIALEQIDFAITVLETAPPTIDTTFTFDFELGMGTLRFRAIVVEFLSTIPDVPVVEQWDWLSDIIESFDGSEQRRALRSVPRLSLEFGITLSEPKTQRRQYNRIYNNIRTRVLVPYYQYAVNLTAPTAINGNRIFFNPALTAIRANQYVLFIDRQTGAEAIAQVDSLEADGAILSDTLTIATTVNTLVMPTIESFLQEGAAINIDTVSGQTRIRAEDLRPFIDFIRPGTTSTVIEFGGIPVLDRRPLAGSEATFLSGKEVIRGDDTSVRRIDTDHSHSSITQSRQFAINRYVTGEMDYWRQFLIRVQGRRNTFYHPTFLTDLTLSSPPEVGTTLLISEGDYAGRFFPFKTYKQIRCELRDGTFFYANVLSATRTEIGLDVSLTDEQLDIVKISFLNLVRLDTDRITLTHNIQQTVLSLSVRTIDA